MALKEMVDFQFSEGAGESTLEWREQIIEDKLALNVYNLQRELSTVFNLSSRVALVQDKNLTLGDVVSRYFNNSDSPELPSRFVHSNDRESNLILKESHIDSIFAYMMTGGAITPQPKELAGYPTRGLQDAIGSGISQSGYIRWQYPRVEGYTWSRGNRVDVDESRAVIIFSPWKVLSEPGASPFPRVYAKGAVRPDELARIAFGYSRYLSSHYNHYFLEVAKKLNRGNLVSKVQGDIF